MVPHGAADPQHGIVVTSFHNVDLDGAMLSASFLLHECAGAKYLSKIVQI